MRIQLSDLRGWDTSDPFVLPIMSVLDTLEREGYIKRDINLRKKIGEINLALSNQLDYYSFIVVPEINKLSAILIKDAKEATSKGKTSIQYKDNKYLGISFYTESLFECVLIIIEQIEKLVKELMNYTGILSSFTGKGYSANRIRLEQIKEARQLIDNILISKRFTIINWYKYMNDLRNFITHEGTFLIDSIEDDNIIFYKRRWDRRYKITFKRISKNVNRFMRLRSILQKDLADVNFWKGKMGI